MKKKVDQKLRAKLRNMWDSGSGLKDEVRELLTKRQHLEKNGILEGKCEINTPVLDVEKTKNECEAQNKENLERSNALNYIDIDKSKFDKIDDKLLQKSERNSDMLSDSGMLSFNFTEEMKLKDCVLKEDIKQDEDNSLKNVINSTCIDIVKEDISFQNVRTVSCDKCNYKVTEIVGDGNCLFRCLSMFLFGNQSKHELIRKNIVNYVVQHWEEECCLAMYSNPMYTYKDVTDYEKKMSVFGEFGTLFEIGIFLKLYNINLKVFVQFPEGKIKKYDESTKDDAEDQFYIMLSGNIESGHWEVLNKINDFSKVDSNENNIMEEPTESSNVIIEDIYKLDEEQNIFQSINAKNSQQEVESNKKQIKNISNNENDIGKNTEQKFNSSHTNYDLLKLDSPKQDVQDPYTFTYKSSVINAETSVDNPVENTNEDTKHEISSSSYSDSSEESEAESSYDSDVSCTSTKQKKSLKKLVKHMVKEEKKAKKKFKFDVGKIEFPSTAIENELGFTEEGQVRTFIEKRLLYDLRCTCTLSYYGRFGRNKKSIVLYANCAHATHDVSFKFIIGHLDEPVSYLLVKSTSGIKVLHEQPVKVTVFRKLKGQERKVWAKEAKNRGVQDFLDEVILKSDEGIKDDGHMQDIRPATIVYKAVSEVKCNDRLHFESLD